MGEIKTMAGWDQFAKATGKHNFDDYCHPGDLIDKEGNFVRAEAVDIRGPNGKGLLCKARVDAQASKGEVVIKDHNVFTMITFRDGTFSVNYYPEDPFQSRPMR